DEGGDASPDFALADLFKAHVMKPTGSSRDRRRRGEETAHTYLRLSPELRAVTDGPHIPSEPRVSGRRHPVLEGFDQTDLLAFGGVLEPLELEQETEVPMTFVPQFPIYPPETAWMRTPKTNIPGLVLSRHNSSARVAFLPADLDRRFGRDHLPDHGNLLANMVRWSCGGSIPLEVKGPGLIDCHLYRQRGRLVLHIVNLTNAATWRQPVDELIPIGPLDVRVKAPSGMNLRRARSLVSGRTIKTRASHEWIAFEVQSVVDHDVVLLS
ncbi:MAG: Tat pathway signal protein, partial [Candidatus Dormibacteraceae bacterium]